MKPKLILTCLLITCIVSAHGQIIRQAINLVAPCCRVGPDSIDIGNDGVDDIAVQGRYLIDAAAFHDACLQPNIRIYNHLLDSGSSPSNPNLWNSYGGGISTSGYVDCSIWNWMPNSGYKYRMFARINGTDSTFGWIKYEFRGVPQFCQDTVFSTELAYTAQPNIKIAAGQTSLKKPGAPAIEVYPTVSSDNFAIINNSTTITPLVLYNMSGQQLLSISLHPDERKQLNLSMFPSGYYILRSPGSGHSRRLCKL